MSTVVSAIGMKLASKTLRNISQSTALILVELLVCKVVESMCSIRLVTDFIQASLPGLIFVIVNVSPLGRGYFKIQFETPNQATKVLVWNHVDFHVALEFITRW
eukprot:c27363_g1_i1 orf=103-414(+)